MNFAAKKGMQTFLQKERLCELAFMENGPFWHVCTDGTRMSDIFCTDDDFRQGMMALAVCILLFGKVRLVTFELMNNHVHLIMCGSEEDCVQFFLMFKGKLKRMFRGRERTVDWDMFEAQFIQIKDLKALRNEILYVHRNAYVVNSNYTPFSYPWGGGWAYFSPVIRLLPVLSVQDLGARKVREMTHCREVSQLLDLQFVEDVPYIPSFCHVDLGQQMFQDARSYFYSLTRNVEEFSLIASRLKESVFLTGEEMYRVASNCAEEIFSCKLSMLGPDQKIQLARKLHKEYNASNDSLRRVLKLDISILNELFPSPRT